MWIIKKELFRVDNIPSELKDLARKEAIKGGMFCFGDKVYVRTMFPENTVTYHEQNDGYVLAIFMLEEWKPNDRMSHTGSRFVDKMIPGPSYNTTDLYVGNFVK